MDRVTTLSFPPSTERWLVPDDLYHPAASQEPRACRSCGAPMLFVATLRSGGQKLAPINPDGSSHFATCTEPARWRKR